MYDIGHDNPYPKRFWTYLEGALGLMFEYGEREGERGVPSACPMWREVIVDQDSVLHWQAPQLTEVSQSGRNMGAKPRRIKEMR